MVDADLADLAQHAPAALARPHGAAPPAGLRADQAEGLQLVAYRPPHGVTHGQDLQVLVYEAGGGGGGGRGGMREVLHSACQHPRHLAARQHPR